MIDHSSVARSTLRNFVKATHMPTARQAKARTIEAAIFPPLGRALMLKPQANSLETGSVGGRHRRYDLNCFD